MKKIFAVILAIILAAPAFAAYYNAAQLKALQDKLAAADKPLKKAELESGIAVFSLDNPTFEVIVSTVTPIYAKYNFDAKRARSRVCQIACFHFNKKFVADAYRMANEDKSLWSWRLIVTHQQTLGLTDQAAFDLLADTIISGREKSPKFVKIILTKMLSIAPSCDAAKVKSALQKINRLLSPRLIKDKASWEPSVAMVRTALETY